MKGFGWYASCCLPLCLSCCLSVRVYLSLSLAESQPFLPVLCAIMLSVHVISSCTTECWRMTVHICAMVFGTLVCVYRSVFGGGEAQRPCSPAAAQEEVDADRTLDQEVSRSPSPQLAQARTVTRPLPWPLPLPLP